MSKKSTRLQNWDYRWDGYYFITICTKNRFEYFGKVENGKMVLSQVGVIADILWYEIKNHAKNVKLDAFVVMPNHIHGILILSGNEAEDDILGKNRFQNQGKNSISSIVGSYKSAVTKHAHRLGFAFAWQSRFYDNIIKNDKAYRNIVQYIEQNPERWEYDKFYS